MQIQQLELPALLPTLDALDAEFGSGTSNAQPGAGDREVLRWIRHADRHNLSFLFT